MRKDAAQGGIDIITESVKTTDISAITVNSATLEKIIGVSDRRIRQLAEEGIVIRASKGRYKLKDSIMNYILTLKVAMEAAGPDSPDGELNLEEEKAIHERVKRHISELKLQVMKGELHRSLLVARNDVGYIRTTLNREVLDALNELKDYNPKDFQGDDFVGEEEDAEGYEDSD